MNPSIASSPASEPGELVAAADAGAPLAALFGLLLVLVAVFGLAWRRRRQALVQAGPAPRPLVLSVTALSPRERLTVVAWDRRHYLVASGPGGICLLDHREATEAPEAGPPPPPSGNPTP